MNKDEYIKSLEKRIEEYEATIADMTAPIIPSIVPQTILVPITGLLMAERFEKITVKILKHIKDHDIEFAIIDFTDITVERIERMCLVELGQQIRNLTESIHLMGVKPYFVGMTPQLIKEIVLSGIELNAETHATFQAALKHLMKINNLVFQKI
ncbi:STAS domain-containing protein [Cytobacillus oceanisediminis]|uniref:RsbT co-antagonist protein RsbR n=1 Tax=Cytobacillus oceanisediminis TaxID=665099 RepID=A0A562JX30_9BACI|nr:STAS domain-containing protein [Cytobacillus oceanisediminis]TWH87741.1 rsbT co-antagonist protein RsbR [Cytobacillus oceanisediminis]